MSNTVTKPAIVTLTSNACPCGRPIPESHIERARQNERVILTCSSCGQRSRPGPRPIARPLGIEAPSGSEPRLPEAIVQANRRAETSPGAILGAVVWYEFPGVELPADDLVDLAKLSGIDEQHVAGIRAHGALGRACRASNVPGFYPLRSHSDDDRLEYAFTRREGSEETDDTGEVRFVRDDVQRVSYDRASKSLTFRTDWREQEIREAFARFQVNVSGTKVSETVKNVLDSVGAVRLREAGVVYFVPAAKLDAVAKIKAFAGRLRALGHKGANVSDAVYLDTPEKREDVRRGAEQDIGSELAQLEASLAEAVEASKHGERKVRVATFLAFKASAELLSEKGRCYADLAELQVAEIRARVEAIGQKVAEVAGVAEV